MARKGQTFRKHSPEFKLSVILDMRENHLGLRETEKRYNISRSVLTKWERKYQEEGFEGLMKDNRGGPTGKKRGRPPKLSKSKKKTLL